MAGGQLRCLERLITFAETGRMRVVARAGIVFAIGVAVGLGLFAACGHDAGRSSAERPFCYSNFLPSGERYYDFCYASERDCAKTRAEVLVQVPNNRITSCVPADDVACFDTASDGHPRIVERRCCPSLESCFEFQLGPNNFAKHMTDRECSRALRPVPLNAEGYMAVQ